MVILEKRGHAQTRSSTLYLFRHGEADADADVDGTVRVLVREVGVHGHTRFPAPVTKVGLQGIIKGTATDPQESR